MIRIAALLFIATFFSACANLRLRTDVTQLNRIYQIRPRQTLYTLTSQKKVVAKTITKLTKAALYERNDTLYAEFLPLSLPPTDANAQSIDQSDSNSVWFYYYQHRASRVEEKSPWFKYQLTTFDVDLFTMPFKYRFGTENRPGELATNPSIGTYIGLRYDRGRYRNVYYRRDRRSDIQSFSFGFGGIISIDPVNINGFDTNGIVADEYDALGFNYGLATIVGYKSLTVGLALGFENLTDHNNKYWIYRQKPWLGFTVGLNLN